MSTTMINKTLIASQALELGDTLVKTHFAKKHGISVRTLNRYLQAYTAEQTNVSDDRISTNNTVEKISTKSAVVKSAAKRIRKPRSVGRVSLVRKYLNTHQNETLKSFYEPMVKESLDMNLPEISKSTWYSIVHHVRKFG